MAVAGASDSQRSRLRLFAAALAAGPRGDAGRFGRGACRTSCSFSCGLLGFTLRRGREGWRCRRAGCGRGRTGGRVIAVAVVTAAAMMPDAEAPTATAEVARRDSRVAKLIDRHPDVAVTVVVVPVVVFVMGRVTL